MTEKSDGNASGSSVLSLDEVRIRRELPRVLPAFDTWCEENSFDRSGAALHPRISIFLQNYARISSGRNITFLEVGAFAATLDELMFGLPTNEFLETTHVLGAYLEFLASTRTWSGTTEEFRRVESSFNCFNFPKYEPDYSEIPQLQAVMITVPKLTEEEAFDAISSMALARRLLSFLRWLGTRREITSAKILNRKHVKEAAAALDVTTSFSTDPAPLGGLRAEGPKLFSSARHVARLGLYWDALVGAGLVDLSATRAYPSKEALQLLDDPPGQLVKAVRRVAQRMYRSVSLELEDIYQGVETGYLTRYFLLEAAVEPISVEVLQHPVRGVEDDDPRGNAEVIGDAWKRLESLATEGLVRIDTKLSIPPVFYKPLVHELAGHSAVEYCFVDSEDDNSDFA